MQIKIKLSTRERQWIQKSNAKKTNTNKLGTVNYDIVCFKKLILS